MTQLLRSTFLTHPLLYYQCLDDQGHINWAEIGKGLKDDAISVYTLGITDDYNITNLEAVASAPTSVFILNKFDEPSAAAKNISKLVCSS